MGANTSNNYFYLPSVGATGSTEKGLFDAALEATDAVIAALVAANGKQARIGSTLTAGESISQYDTCYIASDGKAYKCDADTAAKAIAQFIATEAVTTDSTGFFVSMGEISNGSWSWTIGGVVYLSATAGALTQTPPSSSGQFVNRVGIAISATKILFKPEVTYVEL